MNEQLGKRLESVDPSVESTVFDLYLGDKFRGSILVSYTDSWFEVEDPSEAVEQIPELAAKKTPILSLLTGRIDGERRNLGVGKVYCDLTSFRVVLEIEPEYLKASTLDLSRKIMSPNSGFSLQQNIGVSGVKDEGGTAQSALTHRSFASYGEYFSQVSGAAVQNRPYELNEATAGGIVGDYQIRTGLLQMRGQPFTPSLQFAGFSIDTAEQIFLDDDLARGSPLEIFIPSRSTVQFYKDGQLLAVKVLDYGLQEIDTGTFPQGSYDIDIIIVDSSGRETRERRFYTKAGFLASRGHPVFSFAAGVVRNRLDLLGTPLIQGGVRTRLTDIFDLSANVSSTDNNTIGSLESNGLYRGIRFGVGGAQANGGAKGIQSVLSFPIFGVSLNGRASRTFGVPQASLIPTPTPSLPDFIPVRNILRRDLTIQDQESTTFSALKSVGRFDFRFNVQRNKVEGDITRYSNGPSIDWRIEESFKESVTTRIADLATESGEAKSLQLLYRYRLSQDWALELQTLRRWQTDQGETLVLAGITFDSIRGLAAIGSRVQATIEQQRLTSTSTTNTFTSNVDGEVTNQYLRSTGFARDIESNSDSARTAGINAESAFLVSDNGEFTVAHPVLSDTAFIAEVRGDALAAASTFEVLIDGQVREVIHPGERAIIGLSPYRSYKASIRPTEEAAIVNYDTTIHEFSLFPGNVVKKVWTVDKVFIILGRLIDEEGHIIPHERIKGTKEYTFTEDDGTFQGEVTGRDTLRIDSKRRHCTIELPITTKPEYFIDLHDIVCKTSTSSPSEKS